MKPLNRRKLSPEEVQAVLAGDEELAAEAEAIKQDLLSLAPGECMAFSPDERCTEDGLTFFLWNILSQLPPIFSVMAQGPGEVYVYRAKSGKK